MTFRQRIARMGTLGEALIGCASFALIFVGVWLAAGWVWGVLAVLVFGTVAWIYDKPLSR